MWEKASRGVEMDDIETWIKKECRTPAGFPYLRPFTPNPKWRSAKVFVIGTNPATPLRNQFKSFEAYWRALTQNPEEFNKVYSREHGGGESTTTERLRILTDGLNGINVLVTNAVWLPSSESITIKCTQYYQGHKRLKQLIDGVKPKVIFAYGKPALGTLEKCKKIEGIQHNYPYASDYLTPPNEQRESQRESQSKPLVLTYPHLTGAGLPLNTEFNYKDDLPEFAQIIREYLGKKV